MSNYLNLSFFKVLILIYSFFISNLLADDIRIKINSGQVEPLPIAIADFTGEEGKANEIGRQIAEVISNNLVGSILLDEMSDALSAVYSFFDPKLSKLGMGNFMISECLIFGKKNKYKHLYLGYYISEISSMSYKSRFKPGQILDGSDWQSL